MPALYGDERSSLSEARALVHFPGRLIKTFARRIWLQYFVREFSIVSLVLVAGLLLVLFGTAWGAYHWVRSA